MARRWDQFACQIVNILLTESERLVDFLPVEDALNLARWVTTLAQLAALAVADLHLVGGALAEPLERVGQVARAVREGGDRGGAAGATAANVGREGSVNRRGLRRGGQDDGHEEGGEQRKGTAHGHGFSG